MLGSILVHIEEQRHPKINKKRDRKSKENAAKKLPKLRKDGSKNHEKHVKNKAAQRALKTLKNTLKMKAIIKKMLLTNIRLLLVHSSIKKMLKNKLKLLKKIIQKPLITKKQK